MIVLVTNDGAHRFEFTPPMVAKLEFLELISLDVFGKGDLILAPLPRMDYHLRIVHLHLTEPDAAHSIIDALDTSVYVELLQACNYLWYRELRYFLIAGIGRRMIRFEDANVGGDMIRGVLASVDIDFAFLFLNQDEVLTFSIRYHLFRGHIDDLSRCHDPNWAVQWAADVGHPAMMERLLATPGRGVDPAANDNAPIRLAMAGGHVSIVKMLLAEPAHRGINPFPPDSSLGLYSICTVPKVLQ